MSHVINHIRSTLLSYNFLKEFYQDASLLFSHKYNEVMVLGFNNIFTAKSLNCTKCHWVGIFITGYKTREKMLSFKSSIQNRYFLNLLISSLAVQKCFKRLHKFMFWITFSSLLSSKCWYGVVQHMGCQGDCTDFNLICQTLTSRSKFYVQSVHRVSYTSIQSE